MTTESTTRLTPAARRLCGLAIVLLTTLAMPTPCPAGLVISTPSFSGSPGSTGTFEVIVTNGTANSYDVLAFSTEISVDPTSGVTFTDISMNPTAPDRFIFDMTAHEAFDAKDEGTFPVTPLGSPFGYGVTALYFSDSTELDMNNAALSQTLGADETRVLAVISYAISSSAAGSVKLMLDDPVAPGSFTEIDDSMGSIEPLTVSSGTLSLPRAVPEPSSPLLAALGAGPLVLVAIRRRRRSVRWTRLQSGPPGT